MKRRITQYLGSILLGLSICSSAHAQINSKGVTASLGAASATATVSQDNAMSAAVFIAAGTLAGTVVPEISFDGGTTWTTTSFEYPETGLVVSSVAFTNPNAATSLLIYGAPGATNLRVKVSAYTSGTADATLRASQAGFSRHTFGVTGANLIGTYNSAGAVEKGPRWYVLSQPGVGSKASAAKAAGGAGVYHVVDCVSFSAGSTTAPALTKLNVDLKDGSTIVHSWTVVISAATGQNAGPFTTCGLNIVGTANTAMTLEFRALLANLFEDVSMTGFTVR